MSHLLVIDRALNGTARSISPSASGRQWRFCRPPAETSARLQAIIGQESVSSFARKCGLAESVLRTYLRDGRMPPLDKARAIAAAAGVTLDWLATGLGPRPVAEVRAPYAVGPGSSDGSELPPLDSGVLQGVLQSVLAAPGASASPAELAALAVDRYRRALDPEAP